MHEDERGDFNTWGGGASTSKSQIVIFISNI